MFFAVGGVPVQAEDAGKAPKPLTLIDFTAPDADKQVVPVKGNPKQSVITVDKTGITLNFPRPEKGDADHPGVRVMPAAGKSWDLSAYGHVEAKITNTSPDTKFDVIMHVVDEGTSYWAEKHEEWVGFKPGETKTLKVIFGYQKGFKPAPSPLKKESITEIYFFLWGKNQARSFRIEELKAAGPAGEAPPADQNAPTTQPAPKPKA
jgi:hypothetical protein